MSIFLWRKVRSLEFKPCPSKWLPERLMLVQYWQFVGPCLYAYEPNLWTLSNFRDVIVLLLYRFSNWSSFDSYFAFFIVFARYETRLIPYICKIQFKYMEMYIKRNIGRYFRRDEHILRYTMGYWLAPAINASIARPARQCAFLGPEKRSMHLSMHRQGAASAYMLAKLRCQS